MNLRTNYTQKDWSRFLFYYGVILFSMGFLVWCAVNYFLFPAIDVLNLITGKANANNFELAKKSGVYIINGLRQKYGDDSPFVLVTILLACLFMIIYAFIRIISMLCLVPIWLANKLHLSPKMSLVVIKNDKFWFRIKA